MRAAARQDRCIKTEAAPKTKKPPKMVAAPPATWRLYARNPNATVRSHDFEDLKPPPPPPPRPAPARPKIAKLTSANLARAAGAPRGRPGPGSARRRAASLRTASSRGSLASSRFSALSADQARRPAFWYPFKVRSMSSVERACFWTSCRSFGEIRAFRTDRGRDANNPRNVESRHRRGRDVGIPRRRASRRRDAERAVGSFERRRRGRSSATMTSTGGA